VSKTPDSYQKSETYSILLGGGLAQQ